MKKSHRIVQIGLDACRQYISYWNHECEYLELMSGKIDKKILLDSALSNWLFHPTANKQTMILAFNLLSVLKY